MSGYIKYGGDRVRDADDVSRRVYTSNRVIAGFAVSAYCFIFFTVLAVLYEESAVDEELSPHDQNHTNVNK